MEEEVDRNCLQTAATRTSLTTFPFSKTTCVCNCGKYNLQDLPHLRKILPEDYEYKLCEYLPLDREDKFLVTLRMALATQDEALEWKRRFEEKSLTTHVKDKTFPKVERVSIFKAQYRCQFFDRRKNKKKLPEKSKFRDCHSILFMNIKKHFKNTVDRHMPMYQMVVRLHYAHDHPLDTADVLKKRQLNEGIKCRFLEMFRQGMKPKDALDKHKRELLQNLGPEKYRQVVCDGYYVPNVPKAYRLYYQIHGKGVSAKTTTKRSSRHNPNPDWIAFQDFPDAVATDKDEGCSVDDNDDSYDAADDFVNSCSLLEVNGEAGMEQHHMQAGVSCQGIFDQNGQQNLTTGLSKREQNLTSGLSTREQNLISGISNREQNLASGLTNRDSVIAQDIMVPQPLISKSLDILTAHRGMSHENHIQKVTNVDTTYSNIAVHNTAYTEVRSQNLPAHCMSMSSFSEPHSSIGLFNLTQPPWENINMAHQQTQHNCQGFQNLGHHPSANFTLLQNSNCENTRVPSDIMIDHRSGHQSSIFRTVPTDLNIAESNSTLDCPWTSIQPHFDASLSQLHQKDQQHSQELIRDKTVLSKHISNHNQKVRNLFTKKEIHKKKKPSKELNMKYVTKRWMDRKPKVEAETQNLASEVLQAILLKDEAEKLKASLVLFLSSLESKMTSNPRLFVPAIKHFLQAGEGAKDDQSLALFLKDFGKTEENITKNLEAKKVESRETHSTQTRLSGPIFKLGNIKSKNGNAISHRRNVKTHKRQTEPTNGNFRPNRENVEQNWGITASNRGKGESNIHISDSSISSTANFNQNPRFVAGSRTVPQSKKSKRRRQNRRDINASTVTEVVVSSKNNSDALRLHQGDLLLAECSFSGKNLLGFPEKPNVTDFTQCKSLERLNRPSRSLKAITELTVLSGHKQKTRKKPPNQTQTTSKEVLSPAFKVQQIPKDSGQISSHLAENKLVVKFTHFKQDKEGCP